MAKETFNEKYLWIIKEGVSILEKNEIQNGIYKKAWDYPKAWGSPEFKQKVAYNYKEIDGKTLVISVKEDNDIACIFGTEESTGITYLLTMEELK
jgi:aspartate/methionine/tyrosine aminotransferase